MQHRRGILGKNTKIAILGVGIILTGFQQPGMECLQNDVLGREANASALETAP